MWISHACRADILKAVADFPATLFGTELLELYPDAQVIIPSRDEDSWYASMISTLWAQYVRAATDKSHHMWSLRQAFHKYCWNDDFPTHGRGYFREYYRQIENLVATRRCRPLVYKLGDGWGPLCEFLGKEVPAVPYPRNDAWAQHKLAGSDPSDRARTDGLRN